MNPAKRIESLSREKQRKTLYVMKKKKKKVLSLAEKVRRDAELKEYGRILSLRPSIQHRDKTKYYRKEKHKNEIRTEDNTE